MKNVFKWIGISLLSLISLFIVIILVLVSFEKQIYHSFYSRVEESVEIAGLDTDFVPQGLEYVEEKEAFVMSGYMNKGGPSRIYYCPNIGGNKYVELTYQDKDFFGHVGGISVSGDHVYLASDDGVYHLSLNDIVSAAGGDKVEIDIKYDVDLVPAFTTVYGDYIYVGEFYKKEKYETSEKHHLINADGDTNYAFCYVYKLNTDGSCDFVPEYVLSIPNQVQGLCVSDNKLVISTSWAISNSHLMIYEDYKSNSKTYDYNGTSIDLYVLDSTNLVDDINMPPMSEEIDYHDGKVYISFESAGQKYRNVNVFRQHNVLAFSL